MGVTEIVLAISYRPDVMMEFLGEIESLVSPQCSPKDRLSSLGHRLGDYRDLLCTMLSLLLPGKKSPIYCRLAASNLNHWCSVVSHRH